MQMLRVSQVILKGIQPLPRAQLSSSRVFRSWSACSAGQQAAAGPSETSRDTEDRETLDEDVETVQVEYRGKKMRVNKGSILRSALLRNAVSPHNDQAMYVNCRGLGTCGTCAVQVLGKVVPEQWGTQEKLRLNLPPHHPSRNSHLRLACQVRVAGDLTVIKYNKFWGQGDVALGPVSEEDFKLPLGNLEYITDTVKDAVNIPPKLKKK